MLTSACGKSTTATIVLKLLAIPYGYRIPNQPPLWGWPQMHPAFAARLCILAVACKCKVKEVFALANTPLVEAAFTILIYSNHSVNFTTICTAIC